MSHILLIGRNFRPLAQYLTTHGHEYTLLKDRSLTKFPDKKIKRRVLADFSSRAAILQAVDQIPKKIDGVITVYESYVLPAAWIAAHLHLPGLPIASAEACTDKFLMRQLFTKAPEKISPDFAIAATEVDVRAFAATHDFPLILKPANLAKSLLVTKNHTLEELLGNYQKTQQKMTSVYQKYAPQRQPKLLIEEFLEGSIHSVDAFVPSSGKPIVLEQVVDYQTGYDIGFEDNFHYSRLLPSALPTKQVAALRQVACLGIEALGMKNCPAHVEIIMTNAGPRIVEIAARHGGYRERMHSLANGIEIYSAILAIALGKRPELKAVKKDPCAVLELFPIKPGTFVNIKNEGALRQLPSLVYLTVKTKPGDHIGRAADGYKAAMVIILHNSDPTQFKRDLDFVDNQVAIETI